MCVRGVFDQRVQIVCIQVCSSGFWAVTCWWVTRALCVLASHQHAHIQVRVIRLILHVLPVLLKRSKVLQTR
jgi:hypothetical protein